MLCDICRIVGCRPVFHLRFSICILSKVVFISIVFECEYKVKSIYQWLYCWVFIEVYSTSFIIVIGLPTTTYWVGRSNYCGRCIYMKVLAKLVCSKLLLLHCIQQ